MPVISARDEQTGQVVQFEWNDPTPPTQADLEEVFAAARAQGEGPKKPLGGWLPAIGSTVGSIGGAALGALPWASMPTGGASILAGKVAGGAAGGALGKGAEMLFDDETQTGADAARAMAGEALMQGGTELAFGGAGRLVRGLAPKIAKAALNPAEALVRKYPRLGETYMREGRLFNAARPGAGVGAVGADASIPQTRALLQGSRQQHDAMLAAADAAGTTQPILGRQVIRELRPLYDEAAIAARTGGEDVRPLILERARNFARQNRSMSTADANVLRRSLDQSGAAAHKAAATMGQVTPIAGRVEAALGDALRQRIRTNVPRATPVAARTRELAGLQQALEKAQVRPDRYGMQTMATLGGGMFGYNQGEGDEGNPLGGLKGASAGLLLSYLTRNPAMLGRLALGTEGVGRGLQKGGAQLYRNRAALMALLEALAAEEEAGPEMAAPAPPDTLPPLGYAVPQMPRY